MLKVTTGYAYSANHQRFYAGGTRTYDGPQTQRTLSRSAHCSCGDPIYDGDPICAPTYDETGAVVSVHCCVTHDHTSC